MGVSVFRSVAADVMSTIRVWWVGNIGNRGLPGTSWGGRETTIQNAKTNRWMEIRPYYEPFGKWKLSYAETHTHVCVEGERSQSNHPDRDMASVLKSVGE